MSKVTKIELSTEVNGKPRTYTAQIYGDDVSAGEIKAMSNAILSVVFGETKCQTTPNYSFEAFKEAVEMEDYNKKMGSDAILATHQTVRKGE
jgi:hypothetical protein